MIKNIWAQQSLIRDYIKWKAGINTQFPGNIFVWKPVIAPTTGMYCYFYLDANSDKVSNDYAGTVLKEWTFEFVICWNKKDTPDADIFDALDVLSNAIVTNESSDAINLSWFKIMSIQEGIQSGILRDIENPYLIARYTFIYKYLY